MSVGARIRARRRALGLSQRALGEPGVSYAYISRVEAGARTPSVKALRKLAPKLGVSAHWLETGEDDPLEIYVQEIGLLGGLCERVLELIDDRYGDASQDGSGSEFVALAEEIRAAIRPRETSAGSSRLLEQPTTGRRRR